MVDAIVLAGGLGTRLRDIIAVPKPLASINGIAFLDILIDFIQQSGVVKKIVLALGYKAETIVAHYRDKPGEIPIEFSIEETALGTGGAVVKALEMTDSREVFVMNGDSLCRCSLLGMIAEYRPPVTMAYTQVEDASRYGKLVVEEGNILNFQEKQAALEPGLVNAGVYLFDRKVFERELPKVFSLEDSLFPELLREGVKGFYSDGLFIDIGTKDSYLQAQDILKG